MKYTDYILLVEICQQAQCDRLMIKIESLSHIYSVQTAASHY